MLRKLCISWILKYSLICKYFDCSLHLHEIVEGLYFYWLQFVCVCLSVCEQNADRTDTPILSRSLQNSCLQQSPEPYGNWWHWVKSQGHSYVISIFPFNSLLPSPLWISALYNVQSKWNLVCCLDMPFVWFMFEFDKIQMGDDVIQVFCE